MVQNALIAVLFVVGLAGCGGGDQAVATTSSAKGVLDPSYGAEGRVFYPPGMSDMATAITVAPDGTSFFLRYDGVTIKADPSGLSVSIVPPFRFILIAADRRGNLFGSNGGGAFKFDPTGQIDASFGNGGVVLFRLPSAGRVGEIVKLVPSPDGGLLVIGAERDAIRSANPTMTIARFDAQGRPVTTFGRDGRVEVPTHILYLLASTAFDADGNLYVSYGHDRVFFLVDGLLAPDPSATFRVAKFDRDGNPVTSFGASGIWSGPRGACDSAGVAVDATGFVWIAGRCADAGGVYREVLVKLDSRGTLVPGFGTGGVLEGFLGNPPAGNPGARAWTVAIGPGGTTYVNGWFEIGASDYQRFRCPDFRMVALDSGGNRIATFGANGEIKAVRTFRLDGAGRIYTLENDCPAGGAGVTVLVSRYL